MIRVLSQSRGPLLSYILSLGEEQFWAFKVPHFIWIPTGTNFFLPLINSSLERNAILGMLHVSLMCIKDAYIHLFVHSLFFNPFITWNSSAAVDEKHTVIAFVVIHRSRWTQCFTFSSSAGYWVCLCSLLLTFSSLSQMLHFHQLLPRRNHISHPSGSCPCCYLSAWMSLPLPH